MANQGDATGRRGSGRLLSLVGGLILLLAVVGFAWWSFGDRENTTGTGGAGAVAIGTR